MNFVLTRIVTGDEISVRHNEPESKQDTTTSQVNWETHDNGLLGLERNFIDRFYKQTDFSNWRIYSSILELILKETINKKMRKIKKKTVLRPSTGAV